MLEVVKVIVDTISILVEAGTIIDAISNLKVMVFAQLVVVNVVLATYLYLVVRMD